jgi:hypothetical protein
MKIAIVLHGQPRDYLKGYNNIMAFTREQIDCKFDFFYHCWKINENEKFSTSPWRHIDPNSLIFNSNTITELQNLYNPISYEIENQNDVRFDDSLYKNTIGYNNAKLSPPIFNNINNTLFNMYSKNKARNVLNTYLDEMDNKVHYDFVLSLRFDIHIMPKVNFNKLNKSKVYISNIWYPRKIISDACIIAPTNIYLEWFNVYDMLKDILDNKILEKNVKDLNEGISINSEEIIFAKYIFFYV